MLHSKSIGNKIAEARKKINLSQAELAQQISISPQAVGKWERGESMPDITTLNRLAAIFKVDLNYFSDSFQTDATVITANEEKTLITPTPSQKKRFDWNWDMSRGNWVDADFSGLKNLKEKFSSSNMKNCKFVNADLSGLMLEKNNVESCDFSSSNIRDSKVNSSNLLNNHYHNCSFIDASFQKNNIGKCDFSQADFSGAEFFEVNFEQSKVSDAVWKFTSFKNSNISDIIFDGTLEDCQFENCSFYRVTFQNTTIVNTFFKYNKRFKKVQFVNCTVDKITYAFLKNNGADLTGITVLE